MRHIKRSEPAPDILVTKGEDERKECETYFGPPRQSAEAFPFSIYKHVDVKHALERLFRGKCAYCESFYASGQPMDVEHFRPKGAVEGDEAHPGYWWIAMAWENLLPSCIDCNRKRNQPTPKGDVSQVKLLDESLNFSKSSMVGTGKKDSFPIAPSGLRAKGPGDALSAEKALLLNPCDEDPSEHLEFIFDAVRPVSFVVPKKLESNDPDVVGAGGLSLKGGTSIHVYGLNRLGLVQARTEILRRLEFLGGLVIDLKTLAQDLSDSGTSEPVVERAARALSGLADRVLLEMRRMAQPEMPYSAMVDAWLVSYANRVANPA